MARKSVLAGGVKVGAIFPTNNDGDILVLEVVDSFHVRIVFLEYPYERWVQSGNIILGGIRNPIRPNVCGVGFLGVGSHRAKINYVPNPTHQTWHDMLKRVYTPKNEDAARVYAGTSVHPHWHNFQNFAPWYHDRIDPFGSVDFTWELDKDLLVPGNRQYGPETCCLVPQHVNALFTDHAIARGNLPIGVHERNGYYRAKVNYLGKNIDLGTHSTIAEAQLAYWSAKFKAIRDTAIQYWQYLPEPLAYRLLTFGWDDAIAYYGDDAVIRL